MKNFSSNVNKIDFLNVVDTFAITDIALYVLSEFLTFKTNSLPKAVYSKYSVHSFWIFRNFILLSNCTFATGMSCFDGMKIFSLEFGTIFRLSLLKNKLFIVLFTK